MAHKPLETTPIGNLLQEDMGSWVDDYMAFCELVRRARGEMSLVDLHKARLGRQTYTMSTGERRLWVWEREISAVYVGPIRGICFEVAPGLSKPEALAEWRAYRTALGYPP